MTPLYKRLAVHSAVYAVLFYAMPPLLRNLTGTMSDLGALVTLLLIVCPLAVLLLSAELGFRCGFTPLPALLPALLFVLAVYTVFYGNATGLLYAAAYGLISLAGNAVGALLRTITGRNK